MDFIIGVLLVIVVILVLYNFASISISDSPEAGKCNDSNYLFANHNEPQPVSAKPNTVMNGKVNLDAQSYDYSKYFYV